MSHHRFFQKLSRIKQRIRQDRTSALKRCTLTSYRIHLKYQIGSRGGSHEMLPHKNKHRITQLTNGFAMRLSDICVLSLQKRFFIFILQKAFSLHFIITHRSIDVKYFFLSKNGLPKFGVRQTDFLHSFTFP